VLLEIRVQSQQTPRTPRIWQKCVFPFYRKLSGPSKMRSLLSLEFPACHTKDAKMARVLSLLRRTPWTNSCQALITPILLTLRSTKNGVHPKLGTLNHPGLLVLHRSHSHHPMKLEDSVQDQEAGHVSPSLVLKACFCFLRPEIISWDEAIPQPSGDMSFQRMKA